MQKKAMVVDSDYFFVEFLSELLSKRGYAVLKAYDGKEGVALLENDTIDVLFSDLVLPKVDSRRFFQFIRDKYNGCNIPIVAISGIMIEQLGALNETGADYFIAKGPIDQLTIKLYDFMTEFEARPLPSPVEKKVLATGNVFPRRDAMMLLDSLQYHQAVIECAAAGIIVVDSDTRIVNANRGRHYRGRQRYADCQCQPGSSGNRWQTLGRDPELPGGRFVCKQRTCRTGAWTQTGETAGRH